VHPLATAALGFLLAVLWFDLMFDVQVFAYRRGGDLPEAVVDSIARYYKRVTTDASPMGRVVMVAMVAAIVGLIGQLVEHGARWYLVAALPIAVVPMVLAGARVVPMAVRLGAQTDTRADQSRMARAILRDHLVCVVMIALALALQLGAHS
jgi:mannose/fructose/N-acetylgalactosamine-specific phosphotransferase system component IID